MTVQDPLLQASRVVESQGRMAAQFMVVDAVSTLGTMLDDCRLRVVEGSLFLKRKVRYSNNSYSGEARGLQVKTPQRPLHRNEAKSYCCCCYYYYLGLRLLVIASFLIHDVRFD